MGTKDPVLAPYQTFETADGYLNVACLNQKLWNGLCEAIDRPELADDDRFETNADRVEHMAELETELERTFRELTTDEWMTLLVDEAGLPAGPVHDVEDALYNEQTEARESVTSMEHPEHGEIPVIEHPLKYERSSSGFRVAAAETGRGPEASSGTSATTKRNWTTLTERGAFGSE